MSAIWGAISLTERKIESNYIKILRNAFQNCVIDRYEELIEENLYMGCGIQYFTQEAIKEQLPVCKQEYCFDGDVIIDNRTEMLKKAGLSEEKETVTDGRLLQVLYEKYGNNCLNDLIGAYVAVWYQKERNEITVLADAVGYRYVYYLMQDGIFYYASLMRPLEEIVKNKQINERWIADYIGQDNLNAFTECEETPIQHIYRTAPAQLLKINRKGVKKQVYWTPFQTNKKLRYRSDAEYKEHFLKLYQKCVDDVLRSPEETAVFLSGGYDSTSVACLASKTLKEQGKKLYSFTSVPFHGYESEFGSFYMVDETEMVQKTADDLGNVECTFMDLPEMNCWYDRKEYAKVAEIPYKSPQNMLWLYEGMRQAYQKNARIMLGGMFGNGTVSFENAKLYYVWLFRNGKWVRLYQEVQGLNRRQHYTKKSVLLTTAKDAMHINRMRIKKKEVFGKGYARQEYLKQQGAERRIWKMNRKMRKCTYSHKAYQHAFITPDILRHYGEYAQKNSLYTGVIIRDPTRDKRMIEFVSSIPYHQFTHDGIQRRLISDYMKDIVPEHVFQEKRVGRQSADMKQRLLKAQDKIKEEWVDNYQKHLRNPRIDVEKALKDLEGRKIEDMEDFEVIRHIYTNILLEYLDETENKF